MLYMYLWRLVRLLLVRKVLTLDISYVVLYRISHDGAKVSVATQEARAKALRDAEHVVHDEDLTVYPTASADADDGDR